MDPLGITVGVASLLCSVGKIVNYCNGLQIRYNLAQDLLPAIITECDLMRLAFVKIHDLLESGHERYRDKDDLLNVLENTLAGCSLVLKVLCEEVGIECDQHHRHLVRPSQPAKLKFVCNEAKLRELLTQLRGQQGGLTLILTIMQTQSMNMIVDFVQSNANYLARISQGAQSLRGSDRDDCSDNMETGSIFKFSVSSGKRRTTSTFDKEISVAVPYRKVSCREREYQQRPKALPGIGSNDLPKYSALEGTKLDAPVAVEKARSLSSHIGEDSLSTNPLADPSELVATAATTDTPTIIDQSITTLRIGDGDDIFTALAKRDHSRLQEFVDSDIDLSVRNQSGHSVLSEAAHLGDIEACHILLKGRAGPEAPCHAKSCQHARPIHIAATLNSTTVVSVLLEYGARLGGTSSGHRNALHWAAEHNSPDVGLYLIDKGLDYAASDARGDTPLHIAVTHRSMQFITSYLSSGKVDATKLLERKNVADKTAVHLAIESGGVESLKLLMQFGARTSVLDRNDATLLHYAARQSCHQAVDMLASQGLDVNARDKKGQTPLHHAVLSDFDPRRTIRVLLDLGADLEARQHSHIEVQRPASESLALDPDTPGGKKRKKSVHTHIEGFNGRTPFLLAALHAPAQTVQCLIEAGAHLDVFSACGCGALGLAKRNKDLSVFRLLAETILTSNRLDRTPLCVKILNLAVASGLEFDRMHSEVFSALGLTMVRHGIWPGKPPGVILRSSEGSCSYSDWSMAHVKAALSACDRAQVSIHTRVQDITAVERAIVCWQDGQEGMLELLLTHSSDSPNTLAVIEKAQAQLIDLGQDDGIHPKYYATYRLLGNRRNELIKQLENEKIQLEQRRAAAKAQKEREAQAELQRTEAEKLRQQQTAAWKDLIWDSTSSKDILPPRPRKSPASSKETKETAATGTKKQVRPRLTLKGSEDLKSRSPDELVRMEWQTLFGFDLERKSI